MTVAHLIGIDNVVLCGETINEGELHLTEINVWFIFETAYQCMRMVISNYLIPISIGLSWLNIPYQIYAINGAKRRE